MKETNDIRWKQRYDNFQKACTQLGKFIEKGELNELEEQGLIQCFEYTFELAWKTMKDYLEDEGFMVKSPRETIQLAYQNDIIKDGHVWLDALMKRNLMAHTYNSDIMKEAKELIYNTYYKTLVELKLYLEGKLWNLD